MKALITFFLSISAVIWSGLIASFVTICGVLISNRSNTYRLKLQLQHDAAEKLKERTGILRREVYLCAAEELIKASNFLGSLSQQDLTKTNIAEGFQGFFAAATKLQLVAEPKTALLVNSLVSVYGELLLRLMERLIPLQKTRNDIAINDDLYNKQQTKVERVLSKIEEFNENGQVNEIQLAALNRAFDYFYSQSQKYASERGAAWAQFNNLNIDFCRQLFIDMKPLGELQLKVMIEIRRDLGLTAELGAFQEQMEEQLGRISAQLDSMISSLGC
jgi:hypothetical protein